MDIWYGVVMGVVQGATEFLPVSSSGHLYLVSELFGYGALHRVWFDAAVHFATLIAVMLYFRQDIQDLVSGYLRGDSDKRMYVHALVLGTVPVVVFGFFLYPQFEVFGSVSVVAISLMVSGFILFIIDECVRRGVLQFRVPIERRGLLVGLFQVFALVPGISRSGITIAAGRLAGFSREAAARFSFLLAIPVISGAMALSLGDISFSGEVSFGGVPVLVGMLVSFCIAYGTIHFFLKLVERVGFAPFFVYQILLGTTLLILV